MNRLKRSLFKVDPFQDYVPDISSFNRSGWGLHPIFAYLIPRLSPKLVIEIGTWYGNSAIHMAEIAAKHNFFTEILCIDTFAGSPEHWRKQAPIAEDSTVDGFSDWYDSLKITKGRPSFFESFMNNCLCAGVSNRITPFPVSSETAFFILRDLGITAELIYIDGGHEYDTVMRDLTRFDCLLDPNGVIVVDDYGGWAGVTSAVHEYVYKNSDLLFFAEFGKAVLTRNRELGLSTRFVGKA